jgi:hypothetical protein
VGVQPLPPVVSPSISGALRLEPKYKFGGRPKGLKDSHPRQAPYFKIGHWFKRLNGEWIRLKPIERANICVDMIKLISGKLPKLPSSQRDSTKSAHEVYDALLELERTVANATDDCSAGVAKQQSDELLLRDVNNNAINNSLPSDSEVNK